MNSKIRYAIIGLGLVLFLATAPLIVLFVRGLKFDFKEKRFIQTGILSLKTDPSAVEIFLDDKLARTSAGDLRFLEAKTYRVSVKKPGFFDWHKALRVEPNKVTWANPENNKIHLLLKNQPPELVLTQVKDIIAWDNGALALLENEILIFDSWNFSAPKKIALKQKFSAVRALPDFKTFLLFQEPQAKEGAYVVLLDAATEKFYDLKILVAPKEKLPAFYFSQSGKLLVIKNGSLYSISQPDFRLELLAPKVESAWVLGETAYYLSQTPKGSELISLDLNSGIKQTLVTNSAVFTDPEIFVNGQKRIFILANGFAYTVSTQGLVQRVGNISSWHFEKTQDALMFLASGELRYFNEQANNQLITRLSENISLPKIAQSIGYAFFKQNHSLVALELDQTGAQNSYIIYNGEGIKSYFLDQNAKNFLVLDNGNLKKIRLR